ncbi:hypothetical protein F0562_025603 [Nyssa sinensis]|uniref:ALBINO3-like protein 2, chloroplastic n=1 Tax=Nyssa sinensis TaxID=561372 RepID=A0A5J5BCG9_9ASTE|nr:hypothetical protein F0562_025603 [Nyssa sinensis]
MATPKLLLSRLLRRRRPIPATSCLSASFSSSNSFFMQSPHPTDPSHNQAAKAFNHGLLFPSSTLNSLAPFNLSYYRSFSTRDDSEYGGLKLDGDSTATQSGLLSDLGFREDGGGPEVAETVASISGEEYILPVRALISLLDGFHDLVGLPWWITIAFSTLVLRIALLPLLILQLQKLKRIADLFPKLPPPFPPPLSGRSYIDQISLFQKERRAVGCPSYLWFLTSISVQVPCFFLWMTSIRKMSLDHHPGFDCGGTLWFQNLTELPHGVSGPIFPLLIAGLYFANVQISFRGSSVGKMSGLFHLLVKYYKSYSVFLTLPIFFSGFCIPQGSLVYWLTSNTFTLVQQLSLSHLGVRKKLGLPVKDAPLAAATSVETNTPGIALSDSPIKLQKISVQNLTPRELLAVSGNEHKPMYYVNLRDGPFFFSLSLSYLLGCGFEQLSVQLLAKGHKDRAIPLLKLALDKDPDYVEALIVMGQTLLQNGLAAEATDYLERAISKLFLVGHPTEVEDVDLLILASQWAGVAFVRQGKWAEGIVHLERVACLKEPEDPKSKSHYYDALVLLASALYNEGRKTEAAKYLRMAAAYNSDYNKLLEQCENDEDNVASDLVDSRRRDY